MSMHLWIIPLLPLAGAAINGLLGKRFPKALVNTIALGSTAAAFCHGAVGGGAVRRACRRTRSRTSSTMPPG